MQVLEIRTELGNESDMWENCEGSYNAKDGSTLNIKDDHFSKQVSEEINGEINTSKPIEESILRRAFGRLKEKLNDVASRISLISTPQQEEPVMPDIPRVVISSECGDIEVDTNGIARCRKPSKSSTLNNSSDENSFAVWDINDGRKTSRCTLIAFNDSDLSDSALADFKEGNQVPRNRKTSKSNTGVNDLKWNTNGCDVMIEMKQILGLSDGDTSVETSLGSFGDNAEEYIGETVIDQYENESSIIPATCLAQINKGRNQESTPTLKSSPNDRSYSMFQKNLSKILREEQMKSISEDEGEIVKGGGRLRERTMSDSVLYQGNRRTREEDEPSGNSLESHIQHIHVPELGNGMQDFILIYVHSSLYCCRQFSLWLLYRYAIFNDT